MRYCYDFFCLFCASFRIVTYTDRIVSRDVSLNEILLNSMCLF